MSDKSLYSTKVDIYNQDGDLETSTSNATVLGGRIALETIFKGGFTPGQHLTLDKILSTVKGANIENPSATVQPNQTSSRDTAVAADYHNRTIKYFCIGTGGIVTESPLAMAEPRPYETGLYKVVPFRCVPTGSDLTSEERLKYRMRRKEVINGHSYYTYYLKKFEPGSLNLLKSDGTPYTPAVGDSVEVTPSTEDDHPLRNTSIHSFYEFSMYIDAVDFKEYYKAINNDSLDNAKLTEIGLVLAEDLPVMVTSTDGATYNEVRNVELFSKVVHSPSYMDQEENGKQISYTIYS